MKEKEVVKTTGQDNVSTKEEEDNVQLEAVGSWRGSMNTTLLGLGMTSSAKLAMIEGQEEESGCDQKTKHADTYISTKKKKHYSEKDLQRSEERLKLWKQEHSIK